MPLHKALNPGDIHPIHNFEYADAAARTGASVTSDDIGRVALQQDTDTFYLLKDTTPTWVKIGGAGGGDSASEITVAEHYRQHSDAIRTITKDLDGYALDSHTHLDMASDQTVSEHYIQHSNAIVTILKDLDGYGAGSGDASDATVSEHYKQHSEAFKTILKDLDGYALTSHTHSGFASDTTVSEHYVQHSETFKTILKDLDGYSGGSSSSGVTGAVQFSDGAGGFSSDNPNLHWNDTNNRLIIGATSGSANLDVKGTYGSSTPMIRVVANGASNNMTIGLRYSGSDSWIQSSGILLLNPGGNNVGIGTISPQNRLDVEGATVIGSAYSGTRTAQTDGLLVEGNVGIGIFNFPTDNILRVQGDANGQRWMRFGNINTGASSQSIFRIENGSGATSNLMIQAISQTSTGSKDGVSVAGAVLMYSDNETTSLFFGTSAGGGPLHFMTNNIRAITIDDVQNVILGGDGPHEKLTVNGIISLQEQDNYNRTHDGYGSLWAKSDGKLYYTNDIGTEFDLTAGVSDKRLKNTIKTVKSALDKTIALRGITFKWNDQKKGLGTQMGLIAQEVEKIVPEVIFKDKLGFKNIKHHQLTGLFVEAIKDLKMENSELRNRISILESK